jgi:hypothetical protein
MATTPCLRPAAEGVEDCDGTHEVELRCTHPPMKGRFYGPPEDCYEDEPGEYEITDVAICEVCDYQPTREQLAMLDYDINKFVEQDERSHRYP